MATFTSSNVQKYPNGQAVTARPESLWRPDQLPATGAPLGSATDTQTMTNGTLTFTGLTADARYLAHAQVGGEHRYDAFVAGADTPQAGEAALDIATAIDAHKVAAGEHAIAGTTGLQAALDGKQASDADLTAIAALATTAFGRSLLTQADAAAARATLDTSGRELGYAEATTQETNASTTKGNETWIALSITVTVAARPIVVRASCAHAANNTTNCGAALGIYEGATCLATGIVTDDGLSVGAPINVSRRLAPSPGEHTYVVKINSIIGGTATFVASDGSDGFGYGPAFIQAVEV